MSWQFTVGISERSGMTEELSGRRIVVPETRELGQLVRMLEERGAEAIPCPMIAIRDAPDAEPVAAWLRWFVKGTCDDLVLMTGEGLRRLLGLARRIDLESAFLDALRTTRKITRGPKPVRALREIGLDADIPADEPTTEGIIAAMRRHRPQRALRRRAAQSWQSESAASGFHRSCRGRSISGTSLCLRL